MPAERKEIMFLLYASIAVYLLFVASLYFFQRNFIYFPVSSMPDQALYEAEDMQLVHAETEDGIKLAAWYKAPEKNMPVIVFFHGNASHVGLSALKTQIHRDAGYGALLATYRGYAGNKGKPTEQGLYKDGRAFVNWLITEQNIPEERIVLYGESLGTGIAVELAANHYRDVKAVVLESPYTSFVDLSKKHYPYVLFAGALTRDRYKSIDKIKNVKAPLLIVHGQLDRLVPYVFGKTLFEAANEPKELAALPIAGHNDLHLHGSKQRILHFLSGL